MPLTKEMKENLDAAMGSIMKSCRHFPGGNLARFCAEQQMVGMIKGLRFMSPRGINDDFCLEKLEDEYTALIAKELNY